MSDIVRIEPYKALFNYFKGSVPPETPLIEIHHIVCREYMNNFTNINSNDVFALSTMLEDDKPMQLWKFTVTVVAKNPTPIYTEFFDNENKESDARSRILSLSAESSKPKINIYYAIEIPLNEDKEPAHLNILNLKLVQLANTLKNAIDQAMKLLNK